MTWGILTDAPSTQCSLFFYKLRRCECSL